jgi:hypothetical protein
MPALRPSQSLRAHCLALPLVLLLACGGARVDSVPVPAPRGSASLSAHLYTREQRFEVERSAVTGVVTAVERMEGSDGLLIAIDGEDKQLRLELAFVSELARLEPLVGQTVRASVRVGKRDARAALRGDPDGALLALFVLHTFEARLPIEPEVPDLPADMRLYRGAAAEHVRTADGPDGCFELSFHYTLKVTAEERSYVIPPGHWQDVELDGQAFAMMNRDTWWTRKSSCAASSPSGVALALLRAARPDQTPRASSP